MNEKRKCKHCSSFLSEFDPHTICKPCRQPDPQMFYCSEDDCEACSVIKVYKPLDLVLRKQELENLAKKLKNPVASQKTKVDNKVGKHKKKSQVLGSKNEQPISLKDKALEPSSDIFSTLLKGMQKDKSEMNRSSNKLLVHSGSDISIPSTSGSGTEYEKLKDLETRLYDRIMSSLKTSLSTDSKSNSHEQCIPKACSSVVPTHSKTKTYQKVGLVHPATSPGSSTNEKDDLQDSLVSLFCKVNPDALAKNVKGLNEESKDDYTFKISSRASDNLLKGTVLSSPFQAVKLCDELNIEHELSFWPATLNAADVLHTSFMKLPSMKLHPKVRHMHTMLFGKLNPSLPDELISSSFTLPNVSFELKNECLFAREQLQRLLLMFSLVDYFSGENIVQNGNPYVARLLDLLSNQLQVSMEKQANFVGFLIQEIRRDLLSDAECKDSEAISKLIMGPVHLTQFFGPYVRDLQEIIRKKGQSFCITSKSEKANVNLMKLPPKFRNGDSITKFLNSLRIYFDSNCTDNKDKTAILESLLPKALLERIANFVTPHKVCDKDFEDIALIFEKLDENQSSNYLKERHNFCNTKQLVDQSIKSYAVSLETKLPKCMYGVNAREILRDQFIFGLEDDTLKQYLLTKFTWSFEDCVEYAIKQKQKENEKFLVISGNVKKSSMKRKIEEKDELGPSKVSKIDKMDETNFYSTFSLLNCGSKDKMLQITKLEDWNDHFGLGVKYSFEVYCPWTGQVLRS